MSSLFILLICFIVQRCACSYPSYSEILSNMKLYVAAYNDLGMGTISSQMISAGRSTQGKNIVAYCFGNCRSGSSSVVYFDFCNVAFHFWWHSWERGP